MIDRQGRHAYADRHRRRHRQRQTDKQTDKYVSTDMDGDTHTHTDLQTKMSPISLENTRNVAPILEGGAFN